MLYVIFLMLQSLRTFVIIIILYIYIDLIEFSTIFMVCIPSTVLYKLFFFAEATIYYTVSHRNEEQPPLPDQLTGEHTGLQATHSSQ